MTCATKSRIADGREFYESGLRDRGRQRPALARERGQPRAWRSPLE
jgi:hypothetical protein